MIRFLRNFRFLMLGATTRLGIALSTVAFIWLGFVWAISPIGGFK
jgi:hypothetical protein